MKGKFSKFYLKFAVCLILICSFLVANVDLIKTSKVFADESVEVWDTWSDTWALTDALGRKAADESVAGYSQGDKQVGIFYSVWHDSLLEIAESVDDQAPRNITQIIKNNPETWNTDASLFGPGSSMHYWGEPLYGYYDLAEDDWVVRAHANLLTEAGVDYLLLDMTNFFASGSYNASESNLATINNIFKVFRQIRSEGQKTPTVTMLFTWNPINCGQAINWMYDNVIKDNLDLWFNYEGKPLIYGSGEYVSSEIKNTFTFRSVAANYDAQNSYQWLSNYPQSYVKNSDGSAAVMTVSVAQNWTDALANFSNVNEYGQFIARGRSWTSESSRLLTNPIDPEYNSEYGYNFQEQFNRALDIDPDMLIVTGWNEWTAARFFNSIMSGAGDGLPNAVNFVDGFTTEFSRDIEMTKEGELKDNFYNQLVENIRLYKGVRKSPEYKQVKTISMTNDFSAWESVASYYRDSINDNVIRDADGSAKYHYTNFTGRNDIKELKVCRDDKNIYFYAKCSGKIVGAEDGNWMRLYIKTTGENGWEGFNYVVNKDAPVLNKGKIYKFNGSFENVSEAGSAKVVTKNNEIAVSVAIADLGLDANNLSFEFKWHDNTQVDGDAMEFYVSGDCAPNARFNYVYNEKPVVAVAQKSVSLNDSGSQYQPMTVSETDVVAQRFVATADFAGVDVATYNMNNVGTEYTVSLYRFNQNYQNTVEQAPLTTATYKNCYDETYVYTGAKAISAGEYLLVVSGVKTSSDNSVGLYYCQNQKAGNLYLNGQLSSVYGLKSRIYYLNAKAVEATVQDGTENGLNTKTLTLPANSRVAGISLTAKSTGSFPKTFTVYVSEDGVNYVKLTGLGFNNYTATAQKQTFAIARSVQSVKVVYEGELDSAELLSYSNIDENAGGETNQGSSNKKGCKGVIGSNALFMLGFVAVYTLSKRRR